MTTEQFKSGLKNKYYVLHIMVQLSQKTTSARDCRCENNWVRRIAGVKRVDRRNMDDLREELCIENCLIGRMVKDG